MRKFFFIILACVICAISFASTNEKVIHVVSEEWEDSTMADGTGYYWDILRAVFEPMGYKINTEVMPYIDSVKKVQSGEADISVGAYKGEVDPIMYPHYQFDVDIVVVVFHNDTNFKDISSLNNALVGWTEGYNYNEYIKDNILFLEVQDRDEGLKMLESGKITYYLDAKVDVQDEFDKGVLNEHEYQMRPIIKLPIYFIFSNTKKGQKLKGIYNAIYPDLKKDGTIFKLMEKWEW